MSSFTPSISYFAGAWALRRRIRDQRAGALGVGAGRAVFRADGPERLIAAEVLTLRYRGAEVEGAQTTHWRFEPGGVALSFADGRPFCQAAFPAAFPAAGRMRARLGHACPPDRYDGALTILGPDAWRISWLVRGPRKAYAMRTIYQRESASGDKRIDP